MSQSVDYASVAALAELTSRGLAQAATTNRELREALDMSRLANGVRIGACEISYREEHGERIFDIQTDDGWLITSVVFYETARYLVYRINSGVHPGSPEITEMLRVNMDYRKARDDVQQHAERVVHYAGVGNTFKTDLHEGRYSRATARCRVLRTRLLEVHHPYF